MKILLDSCVWINYVWQGLKSENTKKVSSAVQLVDQISEIQSLEVLLSPFLISEISSHMRDFFILQQIVRDGHSYREMGRERKNYQLTQVQKDEIDEVIFSIAVLNNVNTLSIEKITKEEVEELLLLEADYAFDFYDALHFLVAKKHQCDYLVTTDSGLLKSADSFNKKNDLQVQCIRPKKLINELVAKKPRKKK